ncbi:MAG TPA: hypothetical protein VFZ65_06835 [Planctomycetota bacterium]|nr:hypothetical protein [Planctomycetota bacterium]
MRSRAWSITVVSCLLSGCAEHTGAAEAVQVFGAFQRALQHHDETACRNLLTLESAAALASMPWDRVQERPPLVVLGAERLDGEYRVRVRDPDAGGRVGEFVVVREYGRLVVDLVATAGLQCEVVEAAGAREEVVPRELTPADYDRIREHELAQPPR